MTYGAFGLVEVLGEANAVLVLDRMLKTAEVFYETQDTKCGGHALIFVSGSVSAVTAAVESVKSVSYTHLDVYKRQDITAVEKSFRRIALS